MRVSIADFFFLPKATIALAGAADRLGYTRYWVGEHHTSLQCANPLLLAAVLAGYTSSIRIGTGATLLNRREIMNVAEDARLLTQLYGDRLDLGVTGKPGHDLSAACELLAQRLDPSADPSLGLPYTDDRPKLWIMASRLETAALAARLGAGLCTSFHHGGTRKTISALVAKYRDEFRPGCLPAPHAITVISGIAAPDASRLASARTSYAARDAANRAGDPSQLRTVMFDGLARETIGRALTEVELVGADEAMLLFLQCDAFAHGYLEEVLEEIAAVARLGDSQAGTEE